ncbi:helix-turn-helix domain-containing protein [Pseudomonas sp. D6002]|uniref:LexA family protein n=1 Tax=unclassified Pseudomonas TaxID=196821 RepID=UPI0015A36B56|nr:MULTISPECIES: LexA family transcriptional regulator [unclassified Pseudomonas]NVZ98461.1 helix-turn-helix domain-containing protein [Pseudomonas sp. B6001]NWB14448.1 helix-turn-helix domain-containing protein [Pseudomonas sp. D6002]NWB43724.1 helix-turn-helix domain-containing protein [Pseudomonas sp. E6002]
MDKWIALVKANMKDRKVTQDQLASRLGMSQGGVGHWLNKRRVPSLADMNRVMQELGLDGLEVALVVREKALAAVAEELQPAPHYNPNYRYPVSEGKGGYPLQEEPRPYGVTRFQMSDYHARGKAFWMRVTGDAMTAPSGLSINEGTMILVDPAIQPEPGKLVVAQWAFDSQAILRKWVRQGGQLYLVPLNPTYPKMLFSEECRIIGVVAQAVTRF